MKKITRILPLFTVIFGVLCALMRQQLFANVDGKGLISESHPFYMLLTVLTVLTVLIVGIGALWGVGKDHRILTALPVQGLGCLAAAIGHLLWFVLTPETTGMFSWLKLVVAAAFLAMGLYRFLSGRMPLLPAALASIGMMLLCFGQYRQWGKYTQLHEYLFPAIAAVFVALYSLQYLLMETEEKTGKKAFFVNQLALFSCLGCLSTKLWPYYLCMALWLLSGLFIKLPKMILPKDVEKCIRKLEKAGFTAYCVGGCVRDAMLGRTPHDYDLCTNAKPQDICRVFEDYKLIRNGEKHGTIGVVMDGKVYEITTYRTEGAYQDHRHPDSVEFVDHIQEDLARRDFTVNAMAYHPKTGCYDPYGGSKDLLRGVLRAVGEPKVRFQEDALRILRGVRFACRFRLDIEEETLKAMEELTPLLDQLAVERVSNELTQALCYMTQKDLLRYSFVIMQIIPELKDAVGFDQHNPHHKYDVFTHTAAVVEAVEDDPVLRWAALLHDVGKPKTFTRDEKGIGHFFGHAQVSAEIAEEVLRRLKVSNSLKEQVVFLIEHHMDTLSADENALRKKLSKYGGENLRKLVALQRADRGGKNTRNADDLKTEKILSIIEKLEQTEGCLQIRDLAVNGYDLMELGFAAGPALGDCQQMLLEQVLEGKLPNEKEALTEKAKEYLQAR